jgi:mono/diheme cytochrome c family protein
VRRAPLIPSRRSTRAVALVALALAGAAGLAACGDTVGYSEGSGDRIRGQELFVKGCGSCHTLADAGTAGNGSPDRQASTRDAFYNYAATNGDG